MTDHETKKPWGMELNVFNMLMHLSQLLNFIIPFSGVILPIIMWATNKDEHPEVDQHGKVILNWIISGLIYGLISFILVFIGIGIVLLFVLGIIHLVFVVIAAIKANNNELWPYPISIRFFN